MQLNGRADGANAVKLGGSWFKQMLNVWNESVDIQHEFPEVLEFINQKSVEDLEKLEPDASWDTPIEAETFLQ